MDKLAEIKKLYFATTKLTIERDFDRAIDLLKSMETEDERERATVFMQGLAEMKKEWKGKSSQLPVSSSKQKGASPKLAKNKGRRDE